MAIAMRSKIFGVTTVRELLPYEVEDLGDVVYKRYTDGKKYVNEKHLETVDTEELIIRTTIEGSITRNEKAWAKWADRASATYIPINNPFKDDITSLS